MTTFLALLAAGDTPDTKLYVLGLGALVALIALGLRLFTNMFEVITAPTASLRHVGQTDNLFFSIVLVFLSGIIATFILIVNQNTMVKGVEEAAVQVCQLTVQANPNDNYQDVIESWGKSKIVDFMDVRVFSNLVFFPIVAILGWLVLGFITFLPVKLMGGHTTVKDFLATLAYPTFFYVIGLACSIVTSLSGSKALASQSAPTLGVLGIVGSILAFYSLILWFISVSQAGEIGIGQVIVVAIVMIIITGAAQFAIFNYGISPVWTEFVNNLKTLDPSKTGTTFPPALGL